MFDREKYPVNGAIDDGRGSYSGKHGEEVGRVELVAEEAKYGGTQRRLKSRHIQLIALGGCIGTGLFVGSGATLSTVGPAPFFMAFVVMSLVIWAVMNALAEMTTYMPVQGASAPYYIRHFFEPSLAFAAGDSPGQCAMLALEWKLTDAGWNYWYAYSMLVAAEISAASVVIQYWTTSVHVAVWISIMLAVCVALNVFVVSWYGESEFWFASIKIIAIIGLIILGVVLFFGGGPNHDRLGFRYWQRPGAFKEYQTTGSTGRFLAFWTALVRSGFAFILSPELVILCAGETEAPRRNIPKAAGRFIYRLSVFYILGSLVISVIVASNDPELLQAVSSGKTNAGASPFVLGIQRAGIKGLNHVINAVILTSAWSAGNSFLFAGSRSLYSLAITGQAPSIFRTCNKRGVPWVAVLFSASLACLVYLSVSAGSAAVFNWFLNLTTISGFIAWICIMMTYLRFRKALTYHSVFEQRPYKTPFQPYLTYFMLVLLIVLTLTNGFQVFFPGNFTAATFLAAYITLPIFIVLYLGHKIWFRTPLVYKPHQIDVFTLKEAADRLEEEDVKPVPRNFLERVWFWIA